MLRYKLFTISLLMAFSSAGCSYPEAWFKREVFDSPNGKYRIEIIGDKGQPKFIFDAKVRAEIFSESALMGSTKISFADSFDAGFVNKYGVYGWENDHVFGLRDVDAPKEYSKNDGDVLTVLNKSDKVIGYINVNFTKYYRFIFVNLAPNESASVRKHESDGLAYTFQEGKFLSGESIGKSGVNFSEQSKDLKDSSPPYRFCVVVTNENVAITSNKLVGIKDSDKTTVAADQACGINQ